MVPMGCLCGVGERLVVQRGPLGPAVGGRRSNACRVSFEKL